MSCLHLGLHLFSLSNLNVTTNAEFSAYAQQNYMPLATPSQLTALASAYPSDITQGSPFNTSVLNAVTPEYKRIAAMQGDLVFQAPRRFFLQQRASEQPVWSFRAYFHFFLSSCKRGTLMRG